MLLVILGLVGALVYLNQSGLPGFVKRPLLQKLRDRGVDLEFSRLRLRWYRGIVADNVRFGQTEEPGSPRLSAKEVEIDLNARALARLQLQVDSLVLRGGHLEWPVPGTNTPGRTLKGEDIEARLRLSPDDAWMLDDFRARFAGAQFKLSGTVANASAVREWSFLRGQRPAGPAQWPERLRRLADALEKISYSTPPELRLVIAGDARDLQSFTARLTLHAADADTPWGQATNVVFAARLFPGAEGELSHAKLNLLAEHARTPWADAEKLNLELQLNSLASQTNLVDADLTVQAEHARTPWANAEKLNLELHLDPLASQTNLVDADLTVRAAYAETKWAIVTNLQFTAQWVHSLTNAIPLSGHTELRAATAITRLATAENVRLAANLAAAPNPPPADASWFWWTNLQPYLLDWELEAGGLQSEKLVAQKLSSAGRWDAPNLIITNLHAELYNGRLDAHAALNIESRKAQFAMASDFDAKQIAPLLTLGAQRWLAKYSWAEPPRVRGEGAVVLPAWTNPQPDWRGEVRQTLWLSGEFAVTNGAYLGVPADWARSHLTYSNLIWHLPDLEAGRPDGLLRMTHVADDLTKDYYFRISTTIDPRAVRPLLATNQQRGLDFFTFTQPPVIDGEVWGRWREHDRIGFQARVALTNFAFREQTADSFVSVLSYTNRLLTGLAPQLWRGTQALSAAGLTADFNTMRLHITNGFSTTEPLAVARAIGPVTARALEPYRFMQPPTVHVSGYAPLKNARDTDLRFNVNGGPFEWLRFKLPRIAGDVHWLGSTLALTNMQAEFYWGDAVGFAHFNFQAEPGTEFEFAARVSNANLQMLMSDLSTHTNQLQGWLSGNLTITNANSADLRSWQGYGRARLRDGLIWEIPIFGVLSKPLDMIVPGLGSSSISQLNARFIVTNGVIYSDTLEMRAPAMRLQYEGTVSFDGNVDARVEAEPLRDAWLIGPIFRLALWPVSKIFQYKVTGTLSEPKTEPLYVPKFLLMPLHPFRTLEELFPGGSEKNQAPPVFKEP